MALGPRIRACFGPAERGVSELYRRVFINLDTFAARIHERICAGRILENGCGEGMLTGRLARRFEASTIVGIDISPRLGRLFVGDRRRVTFVQAPLSEYAASGGERFELAVICDVLHHVPRKERHDLLRAARDSLSPGGWLIVKDWEPTPTLPHWLAYASDRYLTGDRVDFPSAAALRGLLSDVCGQRGIKAEVRIPPWRNNLALFAQP